MAAPLLALKALQNRPRISLGSQFTNIILATGLGVGMFLGIRAITKNFKKGVRERQALDPTSAASFATRFKLAFENDNAFGWGTNEEAIYRTIEQIPNAATFKKVQKAYRELYGNNLSADLKSELDTQEYNIVLDIINAKF